jgi:hypothetical protein
MAVTNTLAYCDAITITDEKSLRVQAKAGKKYKTKKARF